MKNKSVITVFSLLLVVILAGAGCVGGRSDIDRARDNGTAGDASRVPEVESALGINLPPDAEIFTVFDNEYAYMTSVLTGLSVRDAQGLMASELSKIGLSPKRAFGKSPTDSADKTSAVYSGNGENWAVNIYTKNGKTEIGIQREY